MDGSDGLGLKVGSPVIGLVVGLHVGSDVTGATVGVVDGMAVKVVGAPVVVTGEADGILLVGSSEG